MPFDFQTIFGNTRVGTFRAGILGWPSWARVALIIPMIPGILLIALSLLLFLVSLIALFVLTAPVYALLSRLFTVRNEEPDAGFSPAGSTVGSPSGFSGHSPGSKRVDATVRDV